MLSDGKWGVNGVCVTWRDRGAEGPEQVGERSALTLAFAFVSLTIIKSHRPHLPSLSISARLFCPGNAPIELPAEEASVDVLKEILLH